MDIPYQSVEDYSVPSCFTFPARSVNEDCYSSCKPCFSTLKTCQNPAKVSLVSEQPLNGCLQSNLRTKSECCLPPVEPVASAHVNVTVCMDQSSLPSNCEVGDPSERQQFSASQLHEAKRSGEMVPHSLHEPAGCYDSSESATIFKDLPNGKNNSYKSHNWLHGSVKPSIMEEFARARGRRVNASGGLMPVEGRQQVPRVDVTDNVHLMKYSDLGGMKACCIPSSATPFDVTSVSPQKGFTFFGKMPVPGTTNELYEFDCPSRSSLMRTHGERSFEPFKNGYWARHQYHRSLESVFGETDASGKCNVIDQQSVASRRKTWPFFSDPASLIKPSTNSTSMAPVMPNSVCSSRKDAANECIISECAQKNENDVTNNSRQTADSLGGENIGVSSLEFRAKSDFHFEPVHKDLECEMGESHVVAKNQDSEGISKTKQVAIEDSLHIKLKMNTSMVCSRSSIETLDFEPRVPVAAKTDSLQGGENRAASVVETSCTESNSTVVGVGPSRLPEDGTVALEDRQCDVLAGVEPPCRGRLPTKDAATSPSGERCCVAARASSDSGLAENDVKEAPPPNGNSDPVAGPLSSGNVDLSSDELVTTSSGPSQIADADDPDCIIILEERPPNSLMRQRSVASSSRNEAVNSCLPQSSISENSAQEIVDLTCCDKPPDDLQSVAGGRCAPAMSPLRRRSIGDKEFSSPEVVLAETISVERNVRSHSSARGHMMASKNCQARPKFDISASQRSVCIAGDQRLSGTAVDFFQNIRQLPQTGGPHFSSVLYGANFAPTMIAGVDGCVKYDAGYVRNAVALPGVKRVDDVNRYSGFSLLRSASSDENTPVRYINDSRATVDNGSAPASISNHRRRSAPVFGIPFNGSAVSLCDYTSGVSPAARYVDRHVIASDKYSPHVALSPAGKGSSLMSRFLARSTQSPSGDSAVGWASRLAHQHHRSLLRTHSFSSQVLAHLKPDPAAEIPAHHLAVRMATVGNQASMKQLRLPDLVDAMRLKAPVIDLTADDSDDDDVETVTCEIVFSRMRRRSAHKYKNAVDRSWLRRPSVADGSCCMMRRHSMNGRPQKTDRSLSFYRAFVLYLLRLYRFNASGLPVRVVPEYPAWMTTAKSSGTGHQPDTVVASNRRPSSEGDGSGECGVKAECVNEQPDKDCDEDSCPGVVIDSLPNLSTGDDRQIGPGEVADATDDETNGGCSRKLRSQNREWTRMKILESGMYMQNITKRKLERASGNWEKTKPSKRPVQPSSSSILPRCKSLIILLRRLSERDIEKLKNDLKVSQSSCQMTKTTVSESCQVGNANNVFMSRMSMKGRPTCVRSRQELDSFQRRLWLRRFKLPSTNPCQEPVVDATRPLSLNASDCCPPNETGRNLASASTGLQSAGAGDADDGGAPDGETMSDQLSASRSRNEASVASVVSTGNDLCPDVRQTVVSRDCDSPPSLSGSATIDYRSDQDTEDDDIASKEVDASVTMTMPSADIVQNSRNEPNVAGVQTSGADERCSNNEDISFRPQLDASAAATADAAASETDGEQVPTQCGSSPAAETSDPRPPCRLIIVRTRSSRTRGSSSNSNSSSNPNPNPAERSTWKATSVVSTKQYVSVLKKAEHTEMSKSVAAESPQPTVARRRSVQTSLSDWLSASSAKKGKPEESVETSLSKRRGASSNKKVKSGGAVKTAGGSRPFSCMDDESLASIERETKSQSADFTEERCTWYKSISDANAEKRGTAGDKEDVAFLCSDSGMQPINNNSDEEKVRCEVSITFCSLNKFEKQFV
jgi:hypothetical protein